MMFEFSFFWKNHRSSSAIFEVSGESVDRPFVRRIASLRGIFGPPCGGPFLAVKSPPTKAFCI